MLVTALTWHVGVTAGLAVLLTLTIVVQATSARARALADRWRQDLLDQNGAAEAAQDDLAGAAVHDEHSAA